MYQNQISSDDLATLYSFITKSAAKPTVSKTGASLPFITLDSIGKLPTNGVIGGGFESLPSPWNDTGLKVPTMITSNAGASPKQLAALLKG